MNWCATYCNGARAPSVLFALYVCHVVRDLCQQGDNGVANSISNLCAGSEVEER